MDYDFLIELENFNEGFSPLAHLDTKTFKGNQGQASEMTADIISKPGFITQSPGLSDLTNGNEDGVVSELIRHILDEPVDSSTTFGVGSSKLYKITPTTVVSGGSPSWPQTISSMTSGESVIRMGENLFIFYNTASAGDIAAMPISTETIDPDWGSSTDQALEKAPHPSATKEDIVLFGNGQYVGAYVAGLNVLDVQKLDFGDGAEVADIVFSANNWWIAVNYANGKKSRVFMYDGSAISNILSDEAGVGSQKVGFLFVHNGIIFLAYDDTSSDGYAIGWLSGREIKPLRYFSGSLPDYRQKSLYKNTIMFISGGSVFSAGASVEQLPFQISRLAAGGLSSVGALAAPFGVPMISSSNGDDEHRLAKFSSYSLESSWKSILIDTTRGRELGNVAVVIVLTKPLGEDARCDLSLIGNQTALISNTMTISGTGKTRHVFRTVNLPAVEDIQAHLTWENGNATNDCPVRKIILLGNYAER